MVLVGAPQEPLGNKAPGRPNTMSGEIPVWVNSRQRWVTGVGRKTTCDDVIAVLLKSEGVSGANGDEPETGASGDGQGHGYAIMERWRRVERPLDGRARILRVWHAWGDAQGEVRLTLRRVDHGEADSGRGSPSREPSAASATAVPPRRRRDRPRHEHSRPRSRHRHHKRPWPPHETVHPRRLAQLQGPLPDTIERLMKLILAQGETIQQQLQRLRERETQIEHLEDETHKARVEALGSNYLLETYLGSRMEEEEKEEKGDDSGVVTEGGSDQASPGSSEEARPKDSEDEEDRFADESEEGSQDDEEEGAAANAALLELKTRIDLWEKLVKVNKRLEREEETLVRLHIKFRRYRSRHPEVEEEASLRVLPDEELDAEERSARDALLERLDEAKEDLERGSRELQHTSAALAEADALLDARKHYLWRLQAELDASDRETERLRQQIADASAAASAAPPVSTVPTASTAESTPKSLPVHQAKTGAPNVHSSSNMDTDSNSDTGLSSLHSGSEEGVYILDTLV